MYVTEINLFLLTNGKLLIPEKHVGESPSSTYCCLNGVSPFKKRNGKTAMTIMLFPFYLFQ